MYLLAARRDAGSAPAGAFGLETPAQDGAHHQAADEAEVLDHHMELEQALLALHGPEGMGDGDGERGEHRQHAEAEPGHAVGDDHGRAGQQHHDGERHEHHGRLHAEEFEQRQRATEVEQFVQAGAPEDEGEQRTGEDAECGARQQGGDGTWGQDGTCGQLRRRAPDSRRPAPARLSLLPPAL